MEYKGTHIYCSSSVANFKNKLKKKFGFPNWNYSKLFKPTLFFGMYHKHDYKRFIIHRGKRIVFWCGSDILNLTWKNNWIFKFFKAKHYCENEKEYYKLLKNGIIAEIKPLFLENIENFPVSYKQSKRPQVWLCMHPGREKEYGINTIFNIANSVSNVIFHIYGIERYKPSTSLETLSSTQLHNTKPIEKPSNIVFHGTISEKQLNEKIKGYQAGLRLNEFDGFSEVIAKSILMGQYPISRIKYWGIDNYQTEEDLTNLLKQLKYKKKPNTEIRNYWLNELKQNENINNW